MSRRVISVLRAPGASPRISDPALEANAFAVAEDIDLSLVLRGRGVELAQLRPDVHPDVLAGQTLPDAAGGRDLQGLLESGVAVYVAGTCLAERGLSAADLLDGVRVTEPIEIARLLRAADAVLTW
jgi:intracellular sulfur oxidation DsrE/DsrF family protein